MPNLILWGGIDNKTVLHSGRPDEVELEVKRVVNGVRKGLFLALLVESILDAN